MTGPEHYAEAERLSALPSQQLENGDPDSLAQLAVMAEAQVHATLAGVYAHNRATTELTGLLHTMLDQIRELREGEATS